jgi:hypothetical protein
MEFNSAFKGLTRSTLKLILLLTLAYKHLYQRFRPQVHIRCFSFGFTQKNTLYGIPQSLRGNAAMVTQITP